LFARRQPTAPRWTWYVSIQNARPTTKLSEERILRPVPADASATYRLFRQAILEEKQIVCTYESRHREMCPHIIGHTNGEEKVLAFQFAGDTSKGQLPPGGQWKCLTLAKVQDIRLRAGRWYAGGSHSKTQVCVREIDLDINVHVRGLRPEQPVSPLRVRAKSRRT
jgi:hypothetical protein